MAALVEADTHADVGSGYQVTTCGSGHPDAEFDSGSGNFYFNVMTQPDVTATWTITELVPPEFASGSAALATAATPSQQGAAATPPEQNLEDLTFSGLVQGQLTTAVNLQPLGHSAPDPSAGFGPWQATQCLDYQSSGLGSSGHGFDIAILGDVGGKRWSVRITLLVRDHVPGTYQILINWSDGQSWLWSQDKATYYQEAGDGTVTVNPDGHSGTMDVVVGPGPYAPQTAHITGSWTCPD
jgi:hypothetical protein